MKVINPVGDDTLLVRYKITRSIRYCSWSNLCPVSCSVGRRGPAITDTKRTIIVRRLIQSVVSVISRVWFIWDRTRGRITRIPRSHRRTRRTRTKNLAKLASSSSSSYRYLYLRNEISSYARKREIRRRMEERRKVCSLLEEEGTIDGWK